MATAPNTSGSRGRCRPFEPRRPPAGTAGTTTSLTAGRMRPRRHRLRRHQGFERPLRRSTRKALQCQNPGHPPTRSPPTSASPGKPATPGSPTAACPPTESAAHGNPGPAKQATGFASAQPSPDKTKPSWNPNLEPSSSRKSVNSRILSYWSEARKETLRVTVGV